MSKVQWWLVLWHFAIHGVWTRDFVSHAFEIYYIYAYCQSWISMNLSIWFVYGMWENVVQITKRYGSLMDMTPFWFWNFDLKVGEHSCRLAIIDDEKVKILISNNTDYMA